MGVVLRRLPSILKIGFAASLITDLILYYQPSADQRFSTNLTSNAAVEPSKNMYFQNISCEIKRCADIYCFDLTSLKFAHFQIIFPQIIKSLLPTHTYDPLIFQRVHAWMHTHTHTTSTNEQFSLLQPSCYRQ